MLTWGYVFIDFQERKGIERERERDISVYHPDWGSNPHPRYVS